MSDIGSTLEKRSLAVIIFEIWLIDRVKMSFKWLWTHLVLFDLNNLVSYLLVKMDGFFYSSCRQNRKTNFKLILKKRLPANQIRQIYCFFLKQICSSVWIKSSKIKFFHVPIQTNDIVWSNIILHLAHSIFPNMPTPLYCFLFSLWFYCFLQLLI